MTRVLPGESSDPHARSPFAAPGVAVREGDEILAVDGRPVDPVYGPWPALAGTHGKPVELTIRPADPSLVPGPPADKDEDDATAIPPTRRHRSRRRGHAREACLSLHRRGHHRHCHTRRACHS